MAKTKEPEVALNPSEQIITYLKNNLAMHDQFEDNVEYKVSSGSLLFDYVIEGGIGPGVVRFCGVAEGGKTSCALSFMKNFLETVKNSRGIYIKAEGKFSSNLKSRTGIKFIENPNGLDKDFEDGTCFIFKTNIYEAAITLMRELVTHNPQKKRYCFILDSMDALVPIEELGKSFYESRKPGAGAALTSDFLRKLSSAMSNRGHICILISQVRSKLDIGYSSTIMTDQRVGNSSGGNAIQHYPEWIFEFQRQFGKDGIWEGEPNKSTKLGHRCKISVQKSSNEQTGRVIEYPIKYGETGGNSIWKEHEILDLLKMYQMISTAGAGWMTIRESLVEEAKKKDIHLEPKIQGEDNFIKYLDQNQNVADFLLNRLKESL